MDPGTATVNVAWACASLPAWVRMRRALRRPAATQSALLLRTIAANRETAFGRAHRFGAIESVEDYRARVPVSTYEDVEPFIQAVVRGERHVLTAAPVRRLVPSGGSCAAVKLIPFTTGQQRAFSRAIDAWLADLFLRVPPLVGGPAYWSISPAAPAPVAVAAVPIGFEDDSMYLGGARAALAGAIMAVPPGVARLADAAALRYATVLFLLRARGLRLISVWHPSFLGGLLDVLDEHRGRLLRDLREGTLSPPGGCHEDARVRLRRMLRPDAARAEELRSAHVGDLRSIWPRLSLISCWGDGPASGPAGALARQTAGVTIQPKGLLATEGVVTIPFSGRHPVAVTSHFYEFLDGRGRARLAHELSRGDDYTVVLTTSGGLYRYRLGDRVRVDGFVDETPSLRFIGKEDRVSDWFGEKLSEGFVAGVLEALFTDLPAPRFALLAPALTGAGLAYTLFLDAGAAPAHVAARLEWALRANPQYAWCVELGQLRPARVVRVTPEAGQAYVDACVARGQRLGDVKPAALRPETGWAEVLPLAPDAETARC